jgi:hypothetical protein
MQLQLLSLFVSLLVAAVLSFNVNPVARQARMANPYTSGQDMNPFADDLRTGAPASQQQRPPQQGMTQQPQFYNPGSSAETQSAPRYEPQHHDNQFGHFQAAPQQQQQQPQFHGGSPPPPQQQQYYAQPPPPGQPPHHDLYGQPHQEPPPQPQAARELQTKKFWTMEFYQQFFDVNTTDVLRRLGNVLVPFTPPDFLQNRDWHSAPADNFVGQRLTSIAQTIAHNAEGEKNADLYGPFWVTTTFWILVGIMGNMYSKIMHLRHKKEGEWSYDFKEATVACAVVYAYVGLMSLMIWGMMKWKAVPAAFPDVLCVYGYSIFVPLLAAILCGVPNTGWQWFVVVLCGFWSSMYLLMNFWRLWRMTLEKCWFICVVTLVVLFQIGFTASLKFYFFNY